MAQPGSYFCSNNFQVLSVTNFCCLAVRPFQVFCSCPSRSLSGLAWPIDGFFAHRKVLQIRVETPRSLGVGKVSVGPGSQSIHLHEAELQLKEFSAPNGGGFRKAIRFIFSPKTSTFRVFLNYFEKKCPEFWRMVALEHGNSVYCSTTGLSMGMVLGKYSLHGAFGCTYMC